MIKNKHSQNPIAMP